MVGYLGLESSVLYSIIMDGNWTANYCRSDMTRTVTLVGALDGVEGERGSSLKAGRK